jgi:sporulation protein YunB
MKRLKLKNKYKYTINYLLFIVFFLIVFLAIILFNIYGNKTSRDIVEFSNQKIDKVLYQLFTDLITDKVISNENVKDIIKITKNKNEEIIVVDYDMENTYRILTNISSILKKAIINLENGIIDVNIYDKYLVSGNNGLLLYVPFFINSKNVFINNIGPTIPVLINFNETLLTNVKTKVTNYGFNNALLELYVTIDMQKLLITPLKKDSKKFNYDILIGAIAINGRVPEFYGDLYEKNSQILDIPLS